MPSEDRRIIFSNDEVYKAIYALSVQRQMSKLPSGRIIGFTEDDKDETKINLIMENIQETEKIKREYTRDFIAAALLMFCKGHGIPVAKSGRKSVLLQNDTVMLRILLG